MFCIKISSNFVNTFYFINIILTWTKLVFSIRTIRQFLSNYNFTLAFICYINKTFNSVHSWFCPTFIFRQCFIVNFAICFMGNPKSSSFWMNFILFKFTRNIIMSRSRLSFYIISHFDIVIFWSNTEAGCFFMVHLCHAYRWWHIIVVITIYLSHLKINRLSWTFWKTIHLFRKGII